MKMQTISRQGNQFSDYNGWPEKTGLGREKIADREQG